MEKLQLEMINAAIAGGSKEVVEHVASLVTEEDWEARRRVAIIALAKAQLGFPKVDENASAGGRYKYATLDNMLGLIGPVLNAHGFCYTFDSHWAAGQLTVYCRLHHEGGHMFVSTVQAPIDAQARMNESQKAGSALSYGKRYAFAAVTGCATGEDDDAQSLGKPTGVQPRAPVRQPKPRPEPEPKPRPEPEPTTQVEPPVPEVSKAQLRRLHSIAYEHGWAAAEVKKYMMETWEVESSADLTIAQYNTLCDEVLPVLNK